MIELYSVHTHIRGKHAPPVTRLRNLIILNKHWAQRNETDLQLENMREIPVSIQFNIT